jgi:hypothetical protein
MPLLAIGSVVTGFGIRDISGIIKGFTEFIQK